ncbi:ribosome maturation factor RimM [Desertivirga arenae]|uniref:ribosome maturation factor RimM n=1 Tax=Desertivirga arenae TaxID=2810309 RepID=UPI001A971FDC|nr:ribosome maturation factor RimM [Pedobacter sp. SYSU D00823]
MKLEECFYIGYVTKTKGLKGEVQVYFEFKDYEELEFDAVFLEVNGKLIPYFVAEEKIQSNSTGYFYFEDIDTIEKAEKLLRKKVYLPNDKMPERKEGDFYYEDLKGFTVIDKSAGELGEITEVLEYPQQFIAVVPYKFREVMFPLNDDIILSIDQESSILEVDLPEGLIDIYVNE